MSPSHLFHAIAFEENFNLRDLARSYPAARLSPQDLSASLPGGGTAFLHPFGTLVFLDAAPEVRDAEAARLASLTSAGLRRGAVHEELSVREDPTESLGVSGGVLTLDRLTRERASVVALTIAQSAAMEFYERLVDDLAGRATALVGRLERTGTMPPLVKPLHRFIGEAVATRHEVLAVLHLLDKPDAAWNDPLMDEIYADLRAEFDLGDRYEALAAKLASVKEAVEVVLEVARDRRMFVLEAAIVLLIVLEVVLGLLKR